MAEGRAASIALKSGYGSSTVHSALLFVHLYVPRQEMVPESKAQEDRTHDISGVRDQRGRGGVV
jgi:hypothetical protein